MHYPSHRVSKCGQIEEETVQGPGNDFRYSDLQSRSSSMASAFLPLGNIQMIVKRIFTYAIKWPK